MWLEGNFRRIFLDMHIEDWNEDFLSKVDPEALVELLADAGAQQIVVKCRTHTGLAHYPTKIGRMHRGLKGRDYVREMIDLCHARGIAVMAYFSQIFDNWAYEAHPEWRGINGEGRTSREYEEYDSPIMFRKGRYGILCPNNEDYRAYVKACLTEMTEQYQFETIFLDMPFWTENCYCPSCRKKYFDATGKDLPRIIDWKDPAFRHWQELREEWMGEFARFSSACVKAVRPEVTIEHNMCSITSPWQSATTDLVAEASDYVGGDLYGGYLQQTFICKYFRNLSKALPFVYITSRCDPGLSYHTTTKSEEELLLHGITALVHNGALSICDGANPDGTLTPRVYTGVVKKAFARSAPYEKYAGGEMHSNVAIWFASRSKYDMSENGNPVCPETFNLRQKNEYIQNPISMAKILREENVPFNVVPSKKLDALHDKLLVVSGVVNIRDEEMEAIEAFVQEGGALYLSGYIGHPRLLELLEAEYGGETEHRVTYMNPTEAGKRFFTDFDAQSPMAVQEAQQILRFTGDYELLARLTLPYTMTGRKEFSAIHSDPPGIHTDMPAAVLKQVGKGQILWVAAPIENARPLMSRHVVGRMVRALCGELVFSSNAPAFVEIVSWTKGGKQYFAVINQQETAPIAPMPGIEVTVPRPVARATMAETGESLPVREENGKWIISLPVLDVFHIFSIE